ncbi:uncharacterized protein LOC113275265 [Papaver somniferum]|uniref:uncharacterized protein LOC113275265 n=1 Tax=Papaver somniferum TaxID=3469 RepID=UPI000E6FF97F|nr:uncharacterized protein LOC113275265 [Papaver somniferum]
MVVLTRLDDIMASVLELDICYHQNVVVQGNELLKSDDAFLLKGDLISQYGTLCSWCHQLMQRMRFLTVDIFNFTCFMLLACTRNSCETRMFCLIRLRYQRAIIVDLFIIHLSDVFSNSTGKGKPN